MSKFFRAPNSSVLSDDGIAWELAQIVIIQEPGSREGSDDEMCSGNDLSLLRQYANYIK